MSSTRFIPSSRVIRITLVAIAVIAGAIGGYMLLPDSERSRQVRRDQEVIEGLRDVQVPREAEVRWVDIQPENPLRAEAARSVVERAIRDPNSVLVSNMQESLVQTILQQLLARSEREPDTYLSLAEHERTRWISEQDPEQEWRLIKMRHEGLFPDIHFNKNEAKLMLRRFLQHELDERQSNLIAIGDGIWGARVHVNRSRTRDDAFYSDLSKEESLYWLGRSTHNAFRFRMPAATVNEILHRHGVIFTASVYIMVESEGGSKYNWNSRWFWDPDRQIWICHAMARTGWDSMVVMHY